LPRIQAGNLAVDYNEAGTGMPIVFIPGITEFKEAFEFQIRGLQGGYRVISYDLRRGLKRATDYTLDALVGDLRDFLRALNLSSAVICGHSFGGLVAMQFALQYPQQTNALILISAFPSMGETSPDRFLSWISSSGHPYHTSLGAKFKVNVARLLGRKSSGALAMEHRFSAVRMIAHQAESVPQAAVAQRMRIIQKTDLTPNLSEIVPPTLVITGSREKGIFLSSAQLLYQEIPNASLEVIEDAGHFSFLTRHDRFNSIVDDYLKDRLAEIS